MAGLEWYFRLRDEVTRPAGSMESQLKRVANALKTLDLASKQARLDKISDPLKKTRLELQIHRDKLLLSKRAIDDHAGSSRKWTESVLKWAGTFVILDNVARGFSAIGRAASDAFDAIQTRQRGLFGLRSTMGNRAGGDFFRQLQREAAVFGRPSGEVTGLGAEFNTAGASPDFARKLVAAVYDVRTATGGRSDISQQLQNIMASPVLNVGNLTSFGGALDLKKLWAAFGARMGRRPGDAEQVLAGRIQGQYVQGGADSPLLKAVFDVIAGMPGGRGGVGNIARGFADTQLEGAIGRLKTSFEQLFASLENSRGLRTLQDVLQNLASTIGGRQVRSALTGHVDTLGKALAPLTGPEGKRAMQDYFATMAKSIDDILPGLKAIVAVTAWFAKQSLKGTAGLAQGAGLLSELATMQGGPTSNVINSVPGMLFGGRGVSLSDEAQRRLAPQPRQPSPYQQFSAPININIDGRSPLNPEGLRIAVEREIARQRGDSDTTTVNDAFEKLGIQAGGF